jgi:cell division protein FtsB
MIGRDYGYSQQTVDALTAERDKLEAENRRLREALDLVLDKNSRKSSSSDREEI